MNIIILFGGASFEHEISIVSAITVKEKLEGDFSLSFVFCDADHTFYLIEPALMKAKTFSSGAYKKLPKLTIVKGGFVEPKLFGKNEIKGNVLNLIHGSDGEDGTIASVLDFYGIDYIGPRTDASVFSYDKRYTKWLCEAKGIKYVPYEILQADVHKDISFSFPVIVKPARLGSSIGVSVVKDADDFDYALDVAYEFDDTVIVEPFIEGVKEYNLAGYMAKGELHYSIVEEPQKQEFLDFEKKYMDFSRSSNVEEAPLKEELVNKLKDSFKTVYEGMFEGALIRCDFFVIDNEVYLNEINPIPGSMANYLFTDFPKAIEALAMSLPKRKEIKVNYEYIHTISRAKGK
jgi:D-alanine-D-alanine ligase